MTKKKRRFNRAFMFTIAALFLAACGSTQEGAAATTTSAPPLFDGLTDVEPSDPEVLELPPTTQPPATTASPTTVATVEGNTEVIRVIDGDTLLAMVDGSEERLRLIGIDAPESNECTGDLSTARLTTLLDSSNNVSVLSDVEERDQYERLLVYVFADDIFINEQLVDEGMALSRRYPPNTSRQTQLDEAGDRAKEQELGIWKPDACGPISESTISVGEIHPDAEGDDSQNLNDEWVSIQNDGPEVVALDGWVLRDESASHRFSFPDGFEISAGQVVTIRSGCGTNSANELFWCATGSAIWNNSGDTIFLLDESGNIHTDLNYQ